MAGENERVHLTEEHLTLDDFFFETVAKDYERFMNEVSLATTPRQQQILAAQSCHGHAMNGDKEFAVRGNGRVIHHQYLNATVADVYDAIIRAFPSYAQGLDAVMKERESLANGLRGWVTEAISGRFRHYNPTMLLDTNGKPLMGIEMFRHTSISSPLSVVKGIYLGSYMDSPYWREQAEDYFSRIHSVPMRMHRGLCTAANLERMDEAGLTVSALSSLADGEDTGKKPRFTLDELKKIGVVVDFSRLHKRQRKEGVRNKKPIIPAYVELQSGYGSSDDAAFNFASLLYGFEAGLGLFLADALDTIDKCLPTIRERGEDELLGDYIYDMLRPRGGVEGILGLAEQDILNLIFAAAIDSEHPAVWPSCSQRRFLEYNPRGTYALLSHIDHIKHICNGHPFPAKIRLSIKEIPSDQFYAAFRQRIATMLELRLIDTSSISHPERFEYFMKE